MSEIGTLKELNLKPGDVVKCVSAPTFGCEWTIGSMYTMTDIGLPSDRNGYKTSSVSTFLIISRATPEPKLWRDMTDAEKGALLLAHHEGEVIEYFNNGWVKCHAPIWRDVHAYRIKPEPNRVTVPLMADFKEIGTIDLVDGKPDFASIKSGDAEGGEA